MIPRINSRSVLDHGTVYAINKNSKPIVAKNKEDETGKYADSMPTRLSDRKDGAKVENADRIMLSLNVCVKQ